MTVTGPNSPGTITQSSTAKADWSNLSNAGASDGSYAGVFLSGAGAQSEEMQCSNFGFAIPSGDIVTSYKVEIECATGIPTWTGSADIKKVASTGDTPEATGLTATTTEAYHEYTITPTYGALTGADVNSSAWAVLFLFEAQSRSDVAVDHVRVTLTHETPPPGHPRAMHQYRQRRV